MDCTTSAAMHTPTTPAAEPFFGRAVWLLALLLGSTLALGHSIGQMHPPQTLSPAAARVAASDRFVVLLGNSRVEAGINPQQLATLLSTGGRHVDVQSFTGGGWDALHYYMIALLAKDVLRPFKDTVVIEVSPLSLNDAAPRNRLGAIRPETALQVASLQGEPIETRFDLLAGSIAGLYRYRVSLQSLLVQPRLEAWCARTGHLLERCGLLGPPPATQAFGLVTEPGRGFVIREIRGDRVAFREINRRRLTVEVKAVRVGGFKLRALERAVEALRARDIAVFLVEVPTSRWFAERVEQSPGGTAFREALPGVAKATGARLLTGWPDSLTDEDRFWDDTHMLAVSTGPFTRALAAVLR
jgi:hypothetical protein